MGLVMYLLTTQVMKQQRYGEIDRDQPIDS